jgi:aromatic ring-cleaving dioxygenase
VNPLQEMQTIWRRHARRLDVRLFKPMASHVSRHQNNVIQREFRSAQIAALRNVLCLQRFN